MGQYTEFMNDFDTLFDSAGYHDYEHCIIHKFVRKRSKKRKKKKKVLFDPEFKKLATKSNKANQPTLKHERAHDHSYTLSLHHFENTTIACNHRNGNHGGSSGKER